MSLPNQLWYSDGGGPILYTLESVDEIGNGRYVTSDESVIEAGYLAEWYLNESDITFYGSAIVVEQMPFELQVPEGL